MKKALSGLIIVVLLVAVAVALSAMFIGWVSSMTGQQMDTMRTQSRQLELCRKVSFEVVTIEINKTNDDVNLPPVVTFRVVNSGIPFDGFRARFIGKQNETLWVDQYFSKGKLGGGLQKDDITWNLSAVAAAGNGQVAYNDLVTVEFLPLINITSPLRTTLRCEDNVYTLDLSQYTLNG